jgi:RND family efflux transporter MFP subunit
MTQESLAGQLKIDRDPAPRRRRRRGGEGGPPWFWIIGGAVLVIALIAAAAWFLTVRPDLTEIETAAAKPAWTGAAAQRGTLLDASGFVVARREATVSAKIAGKVSEVLIQEGQHVTEGEVLARLDDSNALAALSQAQAQAASIQASIAVAQAAVTDDGPKYTRSLALHQRGYLSDQDVEDAKAAYDTARSNLLLAQRQYAAAQATVEVFRRAEDDTVVRAPFSGVVTATAAQPGEIVAPVAGGGFTRTGICTIVDMDSLEIDVDVAESFISRVTPGMPAVVKLDAYPDLEIPAQVITVIPTADRSKATVTVRVGLKIKDPRIVPDMGAHVAFLSPAPAAPAGGAAAAGRIVVVPPDAVQTEDGGQTIVYVISDGHAQRRAVRVGDRTAAGQQIVAGLQPDELVAVEGADHLKDGAGVKIVKGS